ncbi:hypothetical protein [Sanguibacteroides justesenii]|uniref:hypothetical protein n=1 Tax=Sanguibacteroides justesenii TaxID=1547597 RepID=UPI00126A4CBE|nr:hypothetical protein [Sanguibacteroides justesenii]
MRSETVSIPICDYAAAACSTVENRLYYNPTDPSFQDSTAGVGKEKYMMSLRFVLTTDSI